MHTDRRIINRRGKNTKKFKLPRSLDQRSHNSNKVVNSHHKSQRKKSQNNLQSAGVSPRHIKQLFFFILISLSVFSVMLYPTFLFYLAQSIFDVRAWQRHREHVEKGNKKFIELEPLTTFYCVLIMTVNAVRTHQKNLTNRFRLASSGEKCVITHREEFSV